MSSQNPTVTPARPHFVADEFHRVMSIRQLESAVLKIPGVPNARYVVRDGRVFVFKKLIADIQKNQVDVAQSPQAVIDLVESAWVGAIEATTVHGVMPAGYEIEVVDEKFHIRHEALWARIPFEFSSAHDVAVALGSVLLGNAIATRGDFQFDGQWLVFEEPLSLSLPEKPLIKGDSNQVDQSHPMQHPAYEPGLSAFTPQDYEAVRGLITRWCADLHIMAEVSDTEYPDIWAKVLSQEIPRPLYTRNFDHPNNDELRAEAAELARLYPELGGLSASHLHSHYSIFAGELSGHIDIEFIRNEEFSVYLLGLQAQSDRDEDLAYSAGLHTWFSLKRGETWDQACAFAQSCQTYDSSLFTLNSRFTDAMNTLRSRNVRHETLASQGLLWPGVTAVGPSMNSLEVFMREARKCNMQVMESSQDQSLLEPALPHPVMS